MVQGLISKNPTSTYNVYVSLIFDNIINIDYIYGLFNPFPISQVFLNLHNTKIYKYNEILKQKPKFFRQYTYNDSLYT
jgi:hypothetical protein